MSPANGHVENSLAASNDFVTVGCHDVLQVTWTASFLPINFFTQQLFLHLMLIIIVLLETCQMSPEEWVPMSAEVR